MYFWLLVIIRVHEILNLMLLAQLVVLEYGFLPDRLWVFSICQRLRMRNSLDAGPERPIPLLWRCHVVGGEMCVGEIGFMQRNAKGGSNKGFGEVAFPYYMT